MRMLTVATTCLVLLLPARALTQSVDTGQPQTESGRLLRSLPAALRPVSERYSSHRSLQWSDWSAAKKGAVLGFTAGALVGVVLNVLGCESDVCMPGILLSAFYAGAVGAGIGAGVGTLLEGGNPAVGTRAAKGPSPPVARTRRVSIAWRF